MIEQRDQAPGRLECQEQQAQQRTLAGARRAAEELERAGGDVEAEVPQDFGAKSVAQSDILELNHAALRVAQSGKIAPRAGRNIPTSTATSGAADGLTVMHRIGLTSKTSRVLFHRALHNPRIRNN